MPRLKHPDLGTLLEVGDDLADLYASRGFVSADADEKPRRTRRKTAADSDDDN
ncbi:hypothetical protein GCM10007298_38470 [Williamsia phyllosphaerae]|uniref:Uncharacterized protein n=1 Tax=Williamsia phyllosphaerae TaxID=885042 RepID=A0ABQ1V754_9NOCA|nr:hypothetical protein GCM10007298_38470 [Williamsia phyllosphaerae]